MLLRPSRLLLAFLGAASVFFSAQEARAQSCTAPNQTTFVGPASGGTRDYANTDLTLTNGAKLCGGTYTNVRTFSVPAGVVVFIDGTNVSLTAGGPTIQAQSVRIEGVIFGDNSGRAGGAGVACKTVQSRFFGGTTVSYNIGTAGANGSVSGSGGGNGALAISPAPVAGAAGSGGGGGGNGGLGGQGGIGSASGAFGTNGTAPGSGSTQTSTPGNGGGSGSCGNATNVAGNDVPANPPIGSTGGAAGGGGGAAIRLLAKDIEIAGAISVNGSAGGGSTGTVAGGSGGGSGGTIVLAGSERLVVSGTLSANGGAGAAGASANAGGGGGGGGGVIKLFQPFPTCTGVSGPLSVTGGAGGSGGVFPATSGRDGIIACNNIEDAPTISSVSGPTGGAAEGSAITVTVAATDPDVPWSGGTSHLLKYEFDCDNDGAFEVGPQTSNVGTCPGLDGTTASARTINVRVTDWNSIAFAGTTTVAGDITYNGVATRSVTVNVNNVPPTITAMNVPATSNEAAVVAMTSSATDPSVIDAASLTYAWNLGATCSADADCGAGFTCTAGTCRGAGPNVSFTYRDNGSYNVTLTVTDKDGGFATQTKTITVANIVPTIASITTAASATEGVSGSYSAAVTDPSVVDTAAGFTYQWNFGDGTAFATTAAPSHTYAESGTFTITLTVKDKDNGTATSTASVTVANRAPVATISSSPATIDEGASGSYTASVTDSPGDVAAGFDYTWTWGDGTANTVTRTATASHTYVDNGSYTVTLTARDRDGATSSAVTTTVLVRNVAPTVSSATIPGTASEASAATFSAAGADASSVDAASLTYAWDLGLTCASSAICGTGFTCAATGRCAGTGASVTFTYPDSGTYVVSVTVTDKDGATSSATSGTVVVSNRAPTASITLPSSAREGTAATFTASATDPSAIDQAAGFTFRWTWGDGTPDTTVPGSTTATHTYADSGTYTVTLVATDKDGAASAATTATLTVGNAPPAALINVPSTITEGVAAAFSAVVTDASTTDTAAGFSYSWAFGDGTSADTAASPSHVFRESGSYTITLTVTDKDGGQGAASATVLVGNAPPVVSITTAPPTVAEGAPGTFVASATDTAGDASAGFTFRFDWGDGSAPTSSATGTASHAWADNGNYTVSVTATDRDGATSAAVTSAVSITNVAPTSTIRLPATVNEGSAAVFTADVTDPSTVDASIGYFYVWDWGDGSSNTTGTTAAAPSHTYADNGTYTVTLTARDQDGATSAPATATVVVGNLAPVASIVVPGSKGAGQSVSFSATVTDASSLDMAAGYTYSWDFGDGSASSTLAAPAHIYANQGRFTVTLRVTDKDAGATTVTATYAVSNSPPTVAITSVPATSTEGATISVTALGSDTPADVAAGFEYAFDWGDGSARTTNRTGTATHAFADNGSFTVSVTVKDQDGGLSDAATAVVAVSNVAPVASASAPTSALEGSPASFSSTVTDVSSTDLAAGFLYRWDFGDGTAATTLAGLSAPAHTYVDSGTYTVTLTATDKDGAVSAAATASVVVGNVAPTASITLPTATEGVAALFSARVTDPSPADVAAAFAYTWGFGDGTATASGAAPQHTYAESGSYTISLTVRDQDGGSVTTSAVIAVGNAAPTVTVTSAPTSVNEAATASVTVQASDTAGDVAAGFTYTFDWGDASAPTSSASATATHAFADNGSYTVSVRARDRDGATSAAATTVIAVTNVVPVASIVLPISPLEGALATFGSTATDVSSTDTAAGFSYRWNFGDGTAARTGAGLSAPAHTYANSGTYTVTLTVTDKDSGASLAATSSVTVGNVAPSATITVPSGITEGVSATFAAVVTDPSPSDVVAGFTYSWDFGDGSAVSTVASPSHVYAESGSYALRLTVRDADGGQVVATATATVGNAAPVVTVSSAPATVAEAATATVTVQAADTSGDAASGFDYTFDWGDGTSATVGRTATATHAFADNGSYTVSVRARDRDGATSAAATTVIAVTNVVPVAAIVPPQGALESSSATFGSTVTDVSSTDTAAGFTYTWDYGDGTAVATAAGLSAPAHTYANSGTYTVSLTAKDKDNGQSVRATAQVTVGNVAPAATITVPSGITEGVAAAFAAVVTDPSPADVAAGFTYVWDFGDGTATSTLATPTHAFAEDGSYTVRVTVRDQDGGSVIAQATAIVSNRAPVVVVSSAPASVVEAATATVTVVATDSPADTLAGFSYTFAWGDGSANSTGSSPSATHAFADNGTYTVSVTATDRGGATSAPATATIAVTNVVPVAAVFPPASLQEGSAAAFTSTVTDVSTTDTAAGFSFEWDFGDGTPKEQGTGKASPSHTYAEDGSFTVSLVATDKDGGKSTVATASVTVDNVAPTLSIAPPTTLTEGISAAFASSVADPSAADVAAGFTYEWDFGDGTARVSGLGRSAPAHTYAESGTYTVRATATDQDGGVGAASVSVTVGGAAPVVTITSAPATAVEGAQVSVVLAATDTAGDVAAGLEFSVDWGDGSSASRSTTTTGTATLTHAYADNGSYTIRATAKDRDAQTSAVATSAISVSNVAPVVSFTAPAPAPEASAVSFAATVTDASSVDTARGFTFAWDFGDGLSGAGAPPQSHTYADNGTYTVRLTVTDKDGGSTMSQLSMVVTNVVPAVTLGVFQSPIFAAEVSSYTATATDAAAPDRAAGYSYRFDWGDGTTSTVVGSTAATTHTYARTGSFTVSVTATDKDGGVSVAATGEVQVVERPVAPTLALAPATQTVAEGTAAELSATFSDANTGDRVASIAWQFGDGTSDTVRAPASPLRAPHVFDDSGSYTVSAVASDQGGLSTTATATVSVSNVAPTATILSVSADPLEGASVTFAASVTDPSAADTAAGFSYRWSWGDGTADSVGSGLGTTTHVFGDSGTYTVGLVVTDKDGGASSRATVSVSVGNVEPAVTVTGATTGKEGDTLTFGSTATDPGAADTAAGFTYRWVWGDGTADASGAGLATQGHRYLDNGDYTLTLVVTDKDGGTATRTTQVRISNTAPVVALGTFPSPVVAGTSAAFSASATDAPADAAAGFSFAFDWGDGTAATSSATGTASHAFATPGTYTVRVMATDKDGGVSSSVSRSVTVNAPQANGLPTVAIAAVSGVDEGTAASITATFADTDPGDAVVSLQWTFGDGTTETSASPSSPLTISHVFADNGEYTVTAVVTDRSGARATAVTTVRVANVAPQGVSIASASGADEGAEISFTGTATDPSSADRAAGLTYTWRWGDGTPDTAGVGLDAPKHAFADDGTYNVTLVVSDKDGDAGLPASSTIVVSGLAPVVSLSEPAAADEGASVTLAATALDASAADTAAGFTYTWDFGDGSTAVTGLGLATTSHVYADSGRYTVRVTAADADGLSGSATASVTVTNATPVVTLGAFPSPVDSGVPATFTATATDASSIDLSAGLEFSIAWGDGSSDVSRGREFALTHTYAAIGTYVVSVTATDKDGATSAAASGSLTVGSGSSNRAPVVGLTPSSQTIREGASASLTATFSDPDSGDQVVSLDWAFGDGTSDLTASPASPFVLSRAFPESGRYAVQLVASDSRGGRATALAVVTVENEPPAVVLGPAPAGLTTGAAGTFTATATDASAQDTAAGFRYDFSWGDGTTSTSDGASASVPHAYAEAGLYTVTVVATDRDGGTSAPASLQVAVGLGELAPTLAAAPGTQTIVEGSKASATATFADVNPGDAVAELAIDYGDGSPLETLLTPVSPLPLSHTYPDSGTYVVTLRAKDQTGLESTSTLEVIVTNAAPAVVLDAPPSDAREGALLSLGAQVSDASPADAAAGFTYAWDFGDGSALETGAAFDRRSHVFDDNGTYTVRLTVTDVEGAATEVTQQVVVANEAPVPTVTGAATVSIGDALALAATATDASQADTAAGFVVTWSWGDGSADDSGPATLEAAHTYLTPGSYTVTVSFEDKDGGVGSTTHLVTVDDVPPVLEAGADVETVRGRAVLFQPVASWVGGVDRLTWAWDFGDGAGSTDALPSHAYASNGDYTVRVTVTDVAGGTASDTLSVHVLNQKPVVEQVAIAPSAPTTKDELSIAYLFADADGDAEAAQTLVVWYADGRKIDALVGQTKVTPEKTARGQSWFVEVTPHDGFEAGVAVRSEPVVIGNVAPVASDVKLSPATPKRADPLVVTWAYADEDGDVESGTRVQWNRNGEPVPSLDNLARVSGVAAKGERWTATITPNDGDLAGTPVASNEVVIGNTAPLFTKVEDVALTAPGSVALDVQASDADGDQITVTCTQDGAEVTLSQASFPAAGTFTVECTATDGTDTTTGRFRVAVGDVAPLVDAGLDRVVDPGRPIVAAVGRDTQGRALTYFWSVKSSPEPTVFADPNAADTSFFARKSGDYVLVVTVSNGVAQGTDEVTLTVRNVSPTASAGAPVLQAKVGESVTLSGAASTDANGDALTYAWSVVSGPAADLASGATPDAENVTAKDVGELVVRLTVSDGELTGSADVTLLVSASEPGLHPPYANAGEDRAALTDERVVLDGSRSWDPDGETLTYAWRSLDDPPIALDQATEAKASFVATKAGTFRFELEVLDGTFSARDEVVVVVTDAAGNHRPLARVSPETQTAIVGATVALDGTGSTDADEADRSALTFRWSQIAGPFVALSDASSPAVTFVPTVAGEVVLSLVVSDGKVESAPATATITVTASSGAVPVANAGADILDGLFRGEVATLDGSASTSSAGGALAFSWRQVSGPSSAVLNGAASARPSFVPAEKGEYVFELRVADASGISEPDTVTIVVWGDPQLQGGCNATGGASWLVIAGLAGLLGRRRRR